MVHIACLMKFLLPKPASVISILKRTKIHYVGMLKTILPALSLAYNCHLKNQTCSMVMLIVPICYNHNTKCTTDFFSPKVLILHLDKKWRLGTSLCLIRAQRDYYRVIYVSIIASRLQMFISSSVTSFMLGYSPRSRDIPKSVGARLSYALPMPFIFVYCLQFYVRLGPKSPLDEM